MYRRYLDSNFPVPPVVRLLARVHLADFATHCTVPASPPRRLHHGDYPERPPADCPGKALDRVGAPGRAIMSTELASANPHRQTGGYNLPAPPAARPATTYPMQQRA